MTVESTQGLVLATVFYDGQCPMCRREIAHYRRRAGADRIAWLDIASDHADTEAFGLSRREAMARFHVLDASGNWHTGAWGFAELWRHLKGYRWLSALVRALRLLPLLDRAYTRFARWRLRGRCDDAACNVE